MDIKCHKKYTELFRRSSNYLRAIIFEDDEIVLF